MNPDQNFGGPSPSPKVIPVKLGGGHGPPGAPQTPMSPTQALTSLEARVTSDRRKTHRSKHE